MFFSDALGILASSWNIFYTLYTELPEISFPHKKKCRLGCKCHMCGNSFEIKCYITKHLQTKHLILFGSKFKISTCQTYFIKYKTSRNWNWKQWPIPPKKYEAWQPLNKTKKELPLNLEQQHLTVTSAKIYAPLLLECRSTCLRITAETTVIQRLQAGLKIIITKSTCANSVKYNLSQCRNTYPQKNVICRVQQQK